MTPLAARLDERAQQHRATVARLPFEAAAPVGVAVMVVVGVIVGLLVTWWLGILAGLVAGVATVVVRARSMAGGAVDAVLGAVGARPATEVEFPRYLNLAEGLSISTGIPEPVLYVVDDPGANAAAVGAPGDAAIVLTTGLLGALGRVELEGVLAECLHRVRIHEADVATTAAAVLARSLLRTPVADAPPSAVGRANRIAALLGDQRHFEADISASSITRFPPGLRDALVSMAERGTTLQSVTCGTTHLWMCDPLPSADRGDRTAETDSVTMSDHPPIQHRIDLLAEL